MGVSVSKFKVTNNLNQKKGSLKCKSPNLCKLRTLQVTHSIDEISNTTESTTEHKSSHQSNYSQLKYIDETSEGSCEKVEVENDNDSGNASISSKNSHHEDSSNEEECLDDSGHQIRLRNRWSTLHYQSSLTNRLSSTLFNRYSALTLSQFKHFNISKLTSKLKKGDLIEIRCRCSCARANQLRASISHRFRRTLHRQSFHQGTVPQLQISPKRPATLGFASVLSRSCISGSMSDLSSNVSSNQSQVTRSGDVQCSEQLHYVYVAEVNKDSASELLQNVWCFHVRPYVRLGLRDDDRHLGVIKHESLESIVAQFLAEMEERHLQYCRTLKQPKLSVYYRIRNQEKLSQQILSKTLNAIPESDRMQEVLLDATESYVRYHKTMLNSEHYVTLWKYGIGWSTWANTRIEILGTLHHLVERFARLDPEHSSRAHVQGGECSLYQTNLIVQCFGLHSTKLEQSIQQWLQAQVIIAKTASKTTLPHSEINFSNENLFLLPETQEQGYRLHSMNTPEKMSHHDDCYTKLVPSVDTIAMSSLIKQSYIIV